MQEQCATMLVDSKKNERERALIENAMKSTQQDSDITFKLNVERAKGCEIKHFKNHQRLGKPEPENKMFGC